MIGSGCYMSIKRRRYLTLAGVTSVTELHKLLWQSGRICKYCGINMDIPYLDILYEIHGVCWQQYRKNGEKYPMPAHVG